MRYLRTAAGARHRALFDLLSFELRASPGQVRAVRRGGDVALDFAGAPTSAWRLHRGVDRTAPAAWPALAPDVDAAAYVDANRVALPQSPYDAVRGLSPCSATPGP